VRMRGLGKRWRGIVSLLAPVVVGVALAYGWSAADDKMATFRHGTEARAAAMAGPGLPGGRVEGSGIAPEPPLATSERASHTVTGRQAVSRDVGGAYPGEPENVVKSEKNPKYRRKPRPRRGGYGGPLRGPRRPVNGAPHGPHHVSGAPDPRPHGPHDPKPRTPRSAFSSDSRTIQAAGGVSGTPDRGGSVRLPFWKTSETTKGGGACGGLHRSNSCQADPGFARQPNP
jgi:hypothetical protein